MRTLVLIALLLVACGTAPKAPSDAVWLSDGSESVVVRCVWDASAGAGTVPASTLAAFQPSNLAGLATRL
jgi:hypothetical protein